MVTFSPSDNTRVVMRFSDTLKPVYVLGCELVSVPYMRVCARREGQLIGEVLTGPVLDLMGGPDWT